MPECRRMAVDLHFGLKLIFYSTYRFQRRRSNNWSAQIPQSSANLLHQADLLTIC